MKFKDNKELAQALLDGRIFYYNLNEDVSIYWDGRRFIHEYDDGSLNVIRFRSICLDDWEEKSPWDKDIPDGGILCWVSDGDPDVESLVSEIIISKTDDSYIATTGIGWTYAKPLSKVELIKLTENVPEGF